MMSKKEFIQLATSFLPSSDLERFASNVFKLFDEDKNGFLDFGEFSLATSAQVKIIVHIIFLLNCFLQDTLDSRERLVWMFDRVYDKVGCIFSL